MQVLMLLALLGGSAFTFNRAVRKRNLSHAVAAGCMLVLVCMLAPALAHAHGGGASWDDRPLGARIINDPTFGPIVGLIGIALLFLA